jgi:ribonuclease P protein component
VKTEGRTHGGRYFALGVLSHPDSSDPNDPNGSTKAGIITSRRVGGAVVRNQVRRRLREILRHTRPAWKPGFWVVVIARHAAAGATYDQLHAEWLRLAQRAGILPAAAPSAWPNASSSS